MSQYLSNIVMEEKRREKHTKQAEKFCFASPIILTIIIILAVLFVYWLAGVRI